MSNSDKKKFLKELMNNQLKNVPIDRKLHYKDLVRISKYINSSIFDDEKCCIWNGYVTNLKNIKKGTYINFFFRSKKVALHRLFYDNFIGPLCDDEYIKFSCENKGRCCNINHMIKYKYNTISPETINVENNDVKKIENKKNEVVANPINLTIHFD